MARSLSQVREAVPTAASGQCRFAPVNPEVHVDTAIYVVGRPLNDSAFVCVAPRFAGVLHEDPRMGGTFPVEITLNAPSGAKYDFTGGGPRRVLVEAHALPVVHADHEGAAVADGHG